MATFHLIRLHNTPIFKQLQLEEALLRTDERNFCILNSGSTPAIVLGISSKPEEMISQETTLPLIRRFSGGGTVAVDENTAFISFICNRNEFPISPFPREILCWGGQWYHSLLSPHGFSIQENDFTLHNRKFGGNAQYITKDRWLLHSTLLWDYCDQKMSTLTNPAKQPNYRQKRPHNDFLCKLKHNLPKKEALFSGVLSSLEEKHTLVPIASKHIYPILSRPHRKATSIL